MSVFRRKRAGKNGKIRADATWTVEITDHDGMTRRLAAFSDRSASVELEHHIKRLVALRMAGAGPDAALSRFLESCPVAIRDSLAKWGIITGQRAAAGKALVHHVADWKVAMEAKGNCTDHIKQFVSNVQRVADDCVWRNLTDISATNVSQWVSEKRGGGNGRRHHQSLPAGRKIVLSVAGEGTPHL